MNETAIATLSRVEGYVNVNSVAKEETSSAVRGGSRKEQWPDSAERLQLTVKEECIPEIIAE